jgi:hypothetical protein
MAVFASLGDVQKFVDAFGRNEMLARHRRGGFDNRGGNFVVEWLNQDVQTIQERTQEQEESRRLETLNLQKRNTSATERQAHAAERAVDRANIAIVVSMISAVIALLAVYFGK